MAQQSARRAGRTRIYSSCLEHACMIIQKPLALDGASTDEYTPQTRALLNSRPSRFSKTLSSFLKKNRRGRDFACAVPETFAMVDGQRVGLVGTRPSSDTRVVANAGFVNSLNSSGMPARIAIPCMSLSASSIAPDGGWTWNSIGRAGPVTFVSSPLRVGQGAS
jgi:hypothetical protein